MTLAKQQTFALLMSDDGSLTLMSYDWKTEITVKSGVFASLDLFNESRSGFSYEGDGELAADVLEVACRVSGWYPVSRDDLNRKVTEVCSPGPPIRGPRLVKLAPTMC
jgi:hypothetical protein